MRRCGRHRGRPGAGAVPRHQPLRHHARRGPVPGPRREAAARFAFLMGIPIIAGGGPVEDTHDRSAGGAGDVELAGAAAGMIAAAVSGCWPSASCCATCAPTAPGSSSPTGSWLRRRPGAAARRRLTGPGRDRARASVTMEVMKQLRQQAIRDLVAAADPDPAGARGSAAREGLPRHPGDRQPRHRGAGPASRSGPRAVLRMPCLRARRRAELSGEERLARLLLHDLPIEVRSCRHRCSSCGPSPGRRTPSPRRSTAPAGRRWWAPSPATTRSSSPAQTARLADEGSHSDLLRLRAVDRSAGLVGRRCTIHALNGATIRLFTR